MYMYIRTCTCTAYCTFTSHTETQPMHRLATPTDQFEDGSCLQQTVEQERENSSVLWRMVVIEFSTLL